MTGPHRRRAFGLTWEFPFAIPRMPPTQDAAADIVLHLTDVRPAHHEAQPAGVGRWLDPDGSLILEVAGVGRFRVPAREVIQFQPTPDCDGQLRDLVIAGPLAAHILGRWNRVALHGSAVVIQGRTAVITGSSRTGVSTLTAALMRRGASVIGDELVALTSAPDGAVEATGGSTTLQLPLDSAAKLQYQQAEVTRLRPGLARFDVPITTGIEQAPPVGVVYHLGMANDRAITILLPIPLLRVNALLAANWDLEVRRAMDGHGDDFLRVTRIIDHVRFVRVLRPHLPRVTLASLVAFFEEDICR